MAVQDLNGDGYRDLVVGAPGRGGTGAAYLVLGGADGRATGVRALPFRTLPGDDFGAAVALTFADAAMWVYVGAPGRDVSGHADAGAFVQYRIGPADDGGVSIRVLAIVTQDSPLIPDAAEAGDRFGEVLAPGRGVVVGTPLEDLGQAVDAGIVTDIAFGEGQVYSQDTRGIPGAPESGDRFGAAIAGEYVGVPGEDVGRIRDAGMVQRWNPINPRRDIAAFSQSTPGVPGVSEAGDRFGASLASRSISAPFALDLVVGAPGRTSAAQRTRAWSPWSPPLLEARLTPSGRETTCLARRKPATGSAPPWRASSSVPRARTSATYATPVSCMSRGLFLRCRASSR